VWYETEIWSDAVAEKFAAPGLINTPLKGEGWRA